MVTGPNVTRDGETSPPRGPRRVREGETPLLPSPWPELPGYSVLPDGAVPVPGTPGWHIAPDLLGERRIYQLQKKEGGYMPVFPPSFPLPIVRAIVEFSETDALAGRRAFYEIELAGRTASVTLAEMRSGDMWEYWPEHAPGSKAMIARLMDTITTLAEIDRAPHVAGERVTGWRVIEGCHALLLPNGKYYGAGGELEESRAHLALAAHHAAPYALLDTTASVEAQRVALDFTYDAAGRGTGALILCAAVRSILYGVTRADFSVILMGATQLGKSGLTSYTRNLTGTFTGYPLPQAAATFEDTTASIEDSVSQLAHLPVLIDDCTIKPEMTAGERAELGKKLEYVIRSLANNAPVRSRMTRTLERQIERKIESVPVITAEELPAVKLSLLARTTMLFVESGDIDRVALEREADRHAAGLRAFGHTLIAAIAERWDREGEGYATFLRERQAEYRADLRQAIARAFDGKIPDEATRLASNGAHLLLAAELIADCAREALGHNDCLISPETLFSFVSDHLIKQAEYIRRMESGGADSAPLAEWVRDTLARLLQTARLNLDIRDKYTLSDGQISPDKLGYFRRKAGTEGGGNVEYERATGARRLGYYHDKGTEYYCDPKTLHDVLRTAARQDKRPFPKSDRELWSLLREGGILTPGHDGKNTQKLRAGAGVPVRVVVIPAMALFSDAFPDPDSDSDSGHVRQEGTETPATPATSASTANANTAPLTMVMDTDRANVTQPEGAE